VSSAAMQVLGKSVALAPEDLRAALDPWAFVERRTIPGGPAPSAMQSHLTEMRERLAADAAWRQSRQSQIESARIDRRRRLDLLHAQAATGSGAVD
jgi:argininosuccinate lyase